MKIVSITIIISLFLVGCGYKPTKYYAKNEISGKVYIDTSIDISNTTNSIMIKDILNSMIINQFNSTVVNNKNEANTIVMASFSSIAHKAISTDNEGYAKTYRVTVVINVKYKDINKNTSYKEVSVSDYYDYAVSSESVITDKEKNSAVQHASKSALTNLFGKIAINKFKVNDN